MRYNGFEIYDSEVRAVRLEIELNREKISSVEAFTNYQSRCHNMKKGGVFIIQNDTDNPQQLIQDIRRADLMLTVQDDNTHTGYLREDYLDTYLEADKKERLLAFYMEWEKQKNQQGFDGLQYPFRFANDLWETAYRQAFKAVTDEYDQLMRNENRLRNFVVLLFHWIEHYFGQLFKHTKSLSKFPKFIYTGRIKTNEFLFLKFLVLCGCDVYCINSFGLADVKCDDISFAAQIITAGAEKIEKIPKFRRDLIMLEYKKSREQSPVNNTSVRTVRQPVVKTENTAKILAYEELAQMASSVVMITVLDHQNKPFASGSGVLINRSGYIITNFHVVKGAVAFTVQLEDQEECPPQKQTADGRDNHLITAELIKYHSDNDLALLRIDPVDRPPIPLYTGEPLIRGQKVVAIGSPLGLFNTVSDGIIGGFRTIQQVSMIQFTAPISPGSSGGALLNQYGQLIGIVTARFAEGQNLNLAVDYGTVSLFLKGFLNNM